MDKELQDARERWKDAKDAMREQHVRMKEDLEFSNPSAPKQWASDVLNARKGRPCLTFDRTNQFIAQVVNDARQNKPGINVIPADSYGDPDVAEHLNGIVRHIEYTSRAPIAYDTAIEYAARVGLGWIRVLPQVMRPETNEQEIRIARVHDVLSCMLDTNSTEPDGSDAMWGMVESSFTERAFKAAYPKAKTQSFDSEGWFGEDAIRVVEDFVIIESKENRIEIQLEGETMTLSEDGFWQTTQKLGFTPPHRQYEVTVRTQKWRKFNGCEILEETDFPSRWVPIVPVLGYELWVDNKRFLCGMTRRLMDSQRAYNYERSAFIEAVAVQPKAPYMVAQEAIEGHEDAWKALNTSNPAYLPFNAYNDQNNANPQPNRINPPQYPVAFAQGGQIASQDMEASIGMHKANLGQSGNETSGKAILARQREGDTANFHYVDNLSRSIEHLGRIVVDMIPRIYDQPRIARIVGEDGEQSFVKVDPNGPAVRKEGKEVIAINPTVGTYDVRVKTGPSYTTMRQESAEQLAMLIQAQPDLMPIIGDVWVKMQDWPESDKISKRFKAMLPPQIAALEDGQEDQSAMQLQQATQQIQAMEQAGTQLQNGLQQATQELQKMQEQLAKSEQARMKAEFDAQQAQLQAQRAEAMIELSQAEQQAMAAVKSAKPDDEYQRMMFEAEQKERDRQLELAKTQMQEAGKILIARMKEESAPEPAEMQQPDNDMAGILQDLTVTMQALAEASSRPRMLIRDPSGRVEGVS